MDRPSLDLELWVPKLSILLLAPRFYLSSVPDIYRTRAIATDEHSARPWPPALTNSNVILNVKSGFVDDESGS